MSNLADLPFVDILIKSEKAVRPCTFTIAGITSNGRSFRPSDWAERLCGVLACYRPGGTSGRDAHIGYSPYVSPTTIDGVKCVIVDERLKEIEPLALAFALGFAKDNDLTILQDGVSPKPINRDSGAPSAAD